YEPLQALKDSSMYRYKRMIRVQDTDATGVLYFANQLQIGLEAFEDFLCTQGFSIGEMIREKHYFLPIVHTESDFFLPIHVSDILELMLTFPKIGTTSFTHASEVFRKGERVGTVEIVHVVCCPEKKESMPIPDELKNKILAQDQNFYNDAS
ncbi:MAG: thioesterase family protein, partial [Candidatus Neptunochlamydia sp.]|nr:thioesterase family protein [Candidatus Neptunochlamydia sp.]